MSDMEYHARENGKLAWKYYDENVKLRTALVTIRSQYKLFVGPDDKIANSVLRLVAEALNDSDETVTILSTGDIETVTWTPVK